MLEPGQNFAHFKILEKLGEGGMGAVYLAEDQKLRRQVALKILSREYLQDEERRLRFEREARVAASINHSNVMAIHDIGEVPDDTGQPIGYIVMEFVEGQTLGKHLESRPMEMSDIVRLGEKIAAGLAAAHKLGIVHRDIKPDNVVVNGDGDPKILDFGVAKPVDPVLASDEGKEDATMTMADELTRAGRIVGTVTYMSPEQAQGEPVDTRSDVFAFGILLYRMATGEFPFAGKTSVSTLAKIIEGQHLPARQKNEEIHPELERILDKCLRKSPQDRYQDTQDLVVDLRELRRGYDSGLSDVSQLDVTPHLTGGPVTGVSTPSGTGVEMAAGVPPGTDPTGTFTPAGSGSGGKRRLLLGAIVVLVLAFAFISLRGFGEGNVVDASESRLAILAFENKTGDAELDWLETGLPEILLTDLTQCEDLSLISRDRVTDILKMKKAEGAKATHQEWLAAAKELGATNVLSGSFYKLGERIRIDARLEEVATGKILLAEKVVGEDPFDLVDDLTLKVASSLHVVDPTVPGADVTDLTTESPQAFKEYLIGKEKLFLGMGEEARTHFESAIEADSTFALAYMRIAMSYVFEGRTAQSAAYFERAKQFEGKLLPHDRQILNIYNDLWSKRDFSRAMTNMEQYVETYPDDREGKTIYAFLVNILQGDSTKSEAVFDEVLAEDPAYPMALFLYSISLSNNGGNVDRSIELMEIYRKYHPESPNAYELLGDYYRRAGDYQKSKAATEEFLRRFPGKLDVVSDLIILAILERDFEQARAHAAKLATDPDDHLRMSQSWDWLAGIDCWEGKFESAIQKQEKRLEEAKKTGADDRIYAALSELSDFHSNIGRKQAAVAYARELETTENPTNILNRPILAVSADPSLVDEMRPVMREGVNSFKANIPQELWSVGDIVQDLFDAYAASDTLQQIAVLETLIAGPTGGGGGNRLTVGELYVARGEFEKALPHLEHLTVGPRATISGFAYLRALYYSGRCSEGLGDHDAALEKYEEMLSYWSEPEIELDIIEDARARLARLSS